MTLRCVQRSSCSISAARLAWPELNLVLTWLGGAGAGLGWAGAGLGWGDTETDILELGANLDCNLSQFIFTSRHSSQSDNAVSRFCQRQLADRVNRNFLEFEK